MLNELIILQLLTGALILYFNLLTNLIILWYLSGLYLLSLGMLLLLDDGDIFIGFLWIVDLGVGLILFIFILHFSTFLQQKIFVQVRDRNIYFTIAAGVSVSIILIFFAFTPDVNHNRVVVSNWTFWVTWYDYYDIFATRTITDLNLLRELYFYNNSFEFFLINFILFYGILIAISLAFFIKRVFVFLTASQLTLLKQTRTNFNANFIRNQNFLKQQNTSTGTRIWKKKSPKARDDF